MSIAIPTSGEVLSLVELPRTSVVGDGVACVVGAVVEVGSGVFVAVGWSVFLGNGLRVGLGVAVGSVMYTGVDGSSIIDPPP